MEKNQEIIEENKELTNSTKGYQPANKVNKNSYLKEKKTQIYNGLRNFYSGICKAAVPLGTMALIGTNYSKALEYTSNLQSNLLQKSLENPSMLNNIISYNLNLQYLDDILVAGGAAIAIVTARNIAETYNPIEKGLNLAGKGAYKGLKFTGKSACNGGKYMVDGLRDLIGEILIAPFSQKGRVWMSTKETYESNIQKDQAVMAYRKEKLENKMDKLQTRIGNLQTKINELQKLKIGYQDKIVENPELYKNKIEDTNKQMKELYGRKEALQPCAA